MCDHGVYWDIVNKFNFTFFCWNLIIILPVVSNAKTIICNLILFPENNRTPIYISAEFLNNRNKFVEI